MSRPEWSAARKRALGVVAAALVAAGGSAVGVAASSQEHAPQPTAAQAGSVTVPPAAQATATSRHPAAGAAPPAPAVLTAARSLPVEIDIPAIGVHSAIQYVGLNADGTIQVPPLNGSPLTNEAAWYRYSPTPGQPGPAIIEGHIDSAAQGPSVFFHLGALRPGDRIDVRLRDGADTVFVVSGVREYPKSSFPTSAVYGNVPYAGLRLITCGGSFDYSTRHYMANIVVFAALHSVSRPGSGGGAGR